MQICLKSLICIRDHRLCSSSVRALSWSGHDESGAYPRNIVHEVGNTAWLRCQSILGHYAHTNLHPHLGQFGPPTGMFLEGRRKLVNVEELHYSSGTVLGVLMRIITA